MVVIGVLLVIGWQWMQKPKTVPEPVVELEAEPEVELEVETEAKPEPKPKWKRKTCSIGKKVPLTVNKGKRKVGWVRVNQITRLRFSDFTNTKAIASSINYSYSVNLTVHWRKGIADGFTCEPVLKKDGAVMSSVADLGWSGFPTEISFYGGGSTETIEVGVQPEQRGKGSMTLEFHDGDGTKYDGVKVAPKAIKKAKKGPKMLKAGKQVKVKSICGAVYSVVPTVVHQETHLTGNGTETASFLDIGYTVTGWKAPKNGRSVANISGSDKDVRLVCSIGMGVQIAASEEIMRNSFIKALRSEYSSGTQASRYVYDGDFVSFGYHKDLWTNRKLKIGSTRPDFVRVRLEFSDEAAARSLKEKLKFNGRFLVYEIKVTSRF